MNKFDISVCLSGIRQDKWLELYNSCRNSFSDTSFEFIIASPLQLPNELASLSNVKYIKDFGNPSRALQIANYFAEGEMVMAAYDDGLFLDNHLELAVKKMKLHRQEKVIMTLIYTEGDLWKTNEDPRISEPENWYRPKYHGDMKHAAGVKEEWITAVWYLMFANDYRDLGGLDCRFEGINLNIHDLCCRAQRGGYKMIFSEFGKPIQRLSHEPNRGFDSPIISAYHHNDKPLFDNIYRSEESCEMRPIKINFDNWRDVESVWSRKWQIK